MEIMQREVACSYIPQDVQAAIDTILSYCYRINLENQVITKRLGEINKYAAPDGVEEEIARTHKNTYMTESKRLEEIIAHESGVGV